MKTKTGPSLRRYLIAGTILLILFVVVILLVIPSQMYRRLYVSQNERYSLDIAAQTSTGIASALYELDAKVNRLLQEIVGDSGYIRRGAPEESGTGGFSRLVRSYFSIDSLDSYYLEGLELYGKENGAYYHYGAKTERLEKPFDSLYYEHALMLPTEMNWIGYSAQWDSIEIACILYDDSSYEVLGLMVLRLSKDFLLDKFREYNTMEIRNMYILDGGGAILCSRNLAALGTALGAGDRERMTGATGSFQRGGTVTVYSYFSQSTQQYPYRYWCTMVEVEQRAMLRDINTILSLCVGIAILIFLFCVLLVLRLSGYVTGPVQKLVGGMRAVQEGDLDVALELSAPLWEMAYLTQGFNSMVSRLRGQINTIYKEQLARKDMQLKVLQSQINPHFLFNTLQLISWRAKEYDAEPVCDMIYSLGYMLEVALYSREENTLTLREELAYIRHYAYIIEQKYEDKIAIVLEVPETLAGYSIPKLAVQPLIENAIVHGLSQKLGKGCVRLSARQERDDLLIVVEDDGVGIRAEQIHRLESPGKAGGQGHNLALENIQTRIKMMYGEQYGLSISSVPYCGTVVTMRIPVADGQDEGENPDGEATDCRG